MNDLIYFSRAELEARIEKIKTQISELNKVAVNTSYQAELTAQLHLLQDILNSGKDCEEIWNAGFDAANPNASFFDGHPTYSDFTESIKKSK